MLVCFPPSAMINHPAANNLVNMSLTVSASLSVGRFSGWGCGAKVYVCIAIWVEVTELTAFWEGFPAVAV